MEPAVLRMYSSAEIASSLRQSRTVLAWTTISPSRILSMKGQRLELEDVDWRGQPVGLLEVVAPGVGGPPHQVVAQAELGENSPIR